MTHLFHRLQELKLCVTAFELEAITTEVEKVERALVKAEATIEDMEETADELQRERDEAWRCYEAAVANTDALKALSKRWRAKGRNNVASYWFRMADELEAVLKEPA